MKLLSNLRRTVFSRKSVRQPQTLARSTPIHPISEFGSIPGTYLDCCLVTDETSIDTFSEPNDAVGVELRVEIWQKIAGFLADTQALARLVCANHAFQIVIEPFLYQRITLATSRHVLALYNSMLCNSRLPLLVRALHVCDVEGFHNRAISQLLQLLRSLVNLESLTLHILREHGLYGNTPTLDAILLLSHPRLREFTTSLQFSHDKFTHFLAANPHLEHLDVTHGHVSFIGWLDGMRIPLPISLQSLGCEPQLLRAIPLAPHSRPALSRLHLTSVDSITLAQVARLLGEQLVTLRLSTQYAYEHRPMEERWTPDRLPREFPCLRLLHVDMEHVRISELTQPAALGLCILNAQNEDPYLDDRYIDWRSTHKGLPLEGLSCYTVLWTTNPSEALEAGTADDVVGTALSWQSYLTRAAQTVLKEYGPCVARILHGPIQGPFLSVQRTSDELEWVICTDELGMNSATEYWRYA